MKKKTRIKKISGDSGLTDLYLNGRESKSSLRFDCLGDLDELSSLCGVCRHVCKSKAITVELKEIQKTLVLIGSELACSKSQVKKLSSRLGEDELYRLQMKIDKGFKKIKYPKSLIHLGSCEAAAFLHLARAVARRLERGVVKLSKKKFISNKYILAWMNRISVFLYLLALSQEKKYEGIKLK